MVRSKLEQKLFEYENDDDEKLSELYTVFKTVKNKTIKALPSIANTFPHYSRHDITHVECVLDNIERIIGDNRIAQLTIGDVWLLLISVYLHDIGMLVLYEDEEKLWKSDGFQQFLSDCEKGSDIDLCKSAKIVLSKNEQYKPELLPNCLIQIKAEFIRRNHAKRAEEFFNGSLPVSGKFAIQVPDALQNVWMYAGKITKIHGLAFSDILDELPHHCKFLPLYDDYHPRFIACMLRLGDLCDVQNGRFNDFSLAQFGPLPEISALHFNKHKTMEDPQIGENEIVMTANVDFHSIQNELSQEQYDTQTKREDFCQKVVLQHVSWLHMLDSEISFLSRYRDDIFPVKMKKNVPKFIQKISVNNEEVILSLQDMRFNFPREKSFELIEGYSLYDDPLTFIRELIQNSLDALKMQLWHDIGANGRFENFVPAGMRNQKKLLTPFDLVNKIGGPSDIDNIYSNYRIDISVEYDTNEKKAIVIFKDNGIGITKTDIKNKIIQTGTSWHGHEYQSKLAAMPAWLHPTGSFGIGLHSVFAIADHFRIETKTNEESNGNILVLHSGKGHGFVFSRSDKNITDRGTSVIIEIDIDKFPIAEPEINPYEKYGGNPVLETLRDYIKNSVSCPLFNIYLYDARVAGDSTRSIPPLIPQLCDHETYGKLFNPDLRNYLWDRSLLPTNCTNNFDIAIINHRPFRFLLWDKNKQIIYELEPDDFDPYRNQQYKMNFLKNDYEYPSTALYITYMGIILKMQNLSAIDIVPRMLVRNVALLAGDGKSDVTADRNRLKTEKLIQLRGDIPKITQAISLFGQAVLSALLNSKETKSFFSQVEKSMKHVGSGIYDISQLNSDLIAIFKDNELVWIDKILFTIFVYRDYINRNSNNFKENINTIKNQTSHLTKGNMDYYKHIALLWCANPFLNDFTKWVLTMGKELNCTDNSYYFLEIIDEFMKELIFSIDSEYFEVFKDFNDKISNEKLKIAFSEEFVKEFGDEFGVSHANQCGERFSYQLSFSSEYSNNYFGMAFLSGTSLRNRIHDNPLGSSLGSSFFSLYFESYKEVKEKVWVFAPSSLVQINLLGNDNWFWVLWLSNHIGILSEAYLQQTESYSRLLAGYSKVYDFERCDVVTDLFRTTPLKCPIQSISGNMLKFLGIRDYYWSNMCWNNQEQRYYISFIQNKEDTDTQIIKANENDIKRWWKDLGWSKKAEIIASPCFEKYSRIFLPSTYNSTSESIKINNHDLNIPENNSILIFPELITEMESHSDIQSTDNIDATISRIMSSSQTQNIIHNIHLYQSLNISPCSKDEIYSMYSQLIKDYIIAANRTFHGE